MTQPKLRIALILFIVIVGLSAPAIYIAAIIDVTGTARPSTAFA